MSDKTYTVAFRCVRKNHLTMVHKIKIKIKKDNLLNSVISMLKKQ